MSEAAPKDFDEIRARLDEIISQVRSKDTSLERSLDLFDEAIKLGSRAVDMVDSYELSPREADLLDERERAAADAAKAGDAGEGASGAAAVVTGASTSNAAAPAAAGTSVPPAHDNGQ